MPMYVNQFGKWNVIVPHVVHEGKMTTIIGGWVNVSGTWKKFYTPMGNYGQVITHSQQIVLPHNVGDSINVLCIGAGGGGGGGSNRTAHNPKGPGGGGGSGEITITTLSASTFNLKSFSNQTLYTLIGTGGTGGTACDGGYGAGADSGGGSVTGVSLSVISVLNPIPQLIAYANGGNGGNGGYTNGKGGLPNFGGSGTDVVNFATAGGNAASSTAGAGAAGFNIDVTVGKPNFYSVGYTGNPGVGNSGVSPLDLITGAQIPNGSYATSGGPYGGGGGGGGTNNEFLGEVPGSNGASGANGAIFIWWGY